MMRKYGAVIPLGNFCSASFHLRNNDLQVESFPFDWVGFDNVTIPAELIANGFKNYLVPERLERQEGENGTHIPYTQFPEKYLFYHCIDKDLPFADACKKAQDMFKRRIERLYQYINENDSVLFVNTSNDHVEEADALKAQEILQKRFPNKKIDLIVVDMKNAYKDYTVTELSNNVTFVKMEFCHGKDLYSDKKEWFKEILADRKLGSSKDILKTHLHKVWFTIKRLGVNIFCCFIPDKKLRKSIRKKCKVTTQAFGQ